MTTKNQGLPCEPARTRPNKGKKIQRMSNENKGKTKTGSETRKI